MDKLQPQIDWLNKNLAREIKERLDGDKTMGIRLNKESERRMIGETNFSKSAYFLDGRIGKLEKLKGKENRIYIYQTMFCGLVIIGLLIIYNVFF
jgi:hypothetical protein